MPEVMAREFGVRFSEAIDNLKGKLPSASIAWDDLAGPVHAKVFTVAGATTADLARDIQQAMTEAIANGTTITEFRKQFDEIVQRHGWTYRGKRGWRTGVIFNTNMRSAHMAGRWQQIEALASSTGQVVHLQYRTAGDARVRLQHRAWDGKIYPKDDGFWQAHYPPNGWNSIVPDQRVSGTALLGLKARYSGPVVEVTGESGGRFTVTAQHPVLTTRGWIDAQSLCKGDELIAYRSDIVEGAVPADLHEDHLPPTIEEVFETLRTGAAGTVPRISVHLNGDSLYFESDVDVVGADRDLVADVLIASQQLAQELKLMQSSQASGAELDLCSSGSIDTDAFCGIAGTLRPLLDRIRSVLGCDRSLSIRLDPIRTKVTCDVLPALSQLDGDVSEAVPLLVEVERLIGDWLSDLRSRLADKLGSGQFRSLRMGAFRHSSLLDDPIGSFGINPHAHRDIAQRHASHVQVDRVATLLVRDYSGHVFDLQTMSGTIAVHGGECMPHYVVSNCRCTIRVYSQREMDRKGLKSSEPFKVQTRDVVTRDGEIKDRVPVGIDPGWDHNVGKSWIAPELALGQKIASLPPQLRGLVADKSITPAFVQAMSTNWQAARSAAQPAVVGFMDSATLQAVADKVPALSIDSTAMRVVDAAIPAGLDLPDSLRNYRAVLWDAVANELVVVPQGQQWQAVRLRPNVESKLGTALEVQGVEDTTAAALADGRYRVLVGRVR